FESGQPDQPCRRPRGRSTPPGPPWRCRGRRGREHPLGVPHLAFVPGAVVCHLGSLLYTVCSLHRGRVGAQAAAPRSPWIRGSEGSLCPTQCGSATSSTPSTRCWTDAWRTTRTVSTSTSAAPSS